MTIRGRSAHWFQTTMLTPLKHPITLFRPSPPPSFFSNLLLTRTHSYDRKTHVRVFKTASQKNRKKTACKLSARSLSLQSRGNTIFSSKREQNRFQQKNLAMASAPKTRSTPVSCTEGQPTCYSSFYTSFTKLLITLKDSLKAFSRHSFSTRGLFVSSFKINRSVFIIKPTTGKLTLVLNTSLQLQTETDFHQLITRLYHRVNSRLAGSVWLGGEGGGWGARVTVC